MSFRSYRDNVRPMVIHNALSQRQLVENQPNDENGKENNVSHPSNPTNPTNPTFDPTSLHDAWLQTEAAAYGCTDVGPIQPLFHPPSVVVPTAATLHPHSHSLPHSLYFAEHCEIEPWRVGYTTSPQLDQQQQYDHHLLAADPQPRCALIRTSTEFGGLRTAPPLSEDAAAYPQQQQGGRQESIFRVFFNDTPPPYTQVAEGDLDFYAPRTTSGGLLPVKLGGMCSELPLNAVVNALTFLTGVRPLGIARCGAGLCRVWLRDPATEFTAIRDRIHQRLWMAHPEEGACVFAEDESAAALLDRFLGALHRMKGSARFPRHTVTVTVWSEFPPPPKLKSAVTAEAHRPYHQQLAHRPNRCKEHKAPSDGMGDQHEEDVPRPHPGHILTPRTPSDRPRPPLGSLDRNVASLDW